MSNKEKGSEAFHNYYQEIYSDDWNTIVNAFLLPKKYVAIENVFLDNSSKILTELGAKKHPRFKLAWTFEGTLPNPHDFDTALKPFYLLDEASLLPVEVLNIKKEMNILDLCSAPGGKAIYLYFLVHGQANLICNELSQARRVKLDRVLREYIPNEYLQRIKLMGRNANTFGKSHPLQFDRVLCDVPCSSERHLINSPKYLQDWSKKRTLKLSQDQFSILCSGVDALKDEGILSYSTCSISPLENQAHIEKIKKKRSVEIVKNDKDEKDYELIMPNLENPAGPIFCFSLKKRVGEDPTLSRDIIVEN